MDSPKMLKFDKDALFTFAHKNLFDNQYNDALLTVLTSGLNLDVNWRKDEFFDTLLYSAYKYKEYLLAHRLIEMGACVNAGLGGSPHAAGKKRYLSLLDVVSSFIDPDDQSEIDMLKEFGAVSFKGLSAQELKQVLMEKDTTEVAKKGEFVLVDQENLIQVCDQMPEEIQDLVKDFIRDNAQHATQSDIDDSKITRY